MPILRSSLPPSTAVHPALARTLWQWLVLGALAVALLPAARGHSTLLGFVPFWLLLAPAAALATLYRHALAAAWRRRRKTGVRVHFHARQAVPFPRPRESAL